MPSSFSLLHLAYSYSFDCDRIKPPLQWYTPKYTQSSWYTQADKLMMTEALIVLDGIYLHISIFCKEREKVWNSLLGVSPTSFSYVFPSYYPLLFLRHRIDHMKEMQGKEDKAFSFSFLFLTALIQRLVLATGYLARKGPCVVQEGHSQSYYCKNKQKPLS